MAVHYSCAPDDGCMWRPKHVELEIFQEKLILYIQLDSNKTYISFYSSSLRLYVFMACVMKIPPIFSPPLLIHQPQIYKRGSVLKRKIKARTFNHCCCEKAITLTYYHCVFVSSMQGACALLSSVASQAPQYFPHYLINGMVFEEKSLNIKCVFFIFCTTFVWNISHMKNWVRYYGNCILIFMQSSHYSCPILIKLLFSLQNCEI
jgi:hypothetical protein